MLKTFFKTIEELNKLASVDLELELDNIQPDIQYVEEIYLKPLLSAGFFNALLDNYQDDTLTVPEQELVEKVQAASANLAVWKYTPRNNVKAGNAGLLRHENENEKSARQWQVVSYKNAFRDRGFDLIDIMLDYLETNKASFPVWAASEAFTAFKEHFINTAADFNKIVPINNSRRLFVKMKATMAYVEEFVIEPLISEALAQVLQTQILEDNLTPVNEKLLVLIQKAVAHQTMAAAVVFLSLKINADGIFVIDNDNTKTIDASKPADDSKLSRLIKDHEKAAALYVGKIEKLINKDPENEYPEYFNSDAYVEIKTPFQFQNKQENGVYFP